MTAGIVMGSTSPLGADVLFCSPASLLSLFLSVTSLPVRSSEINWLISSTCGPDGAVPRVPVGFFGLYCACVMFIVSLSVNL